MTYKSSINRFLTEYKMICRANGLDQLRLNYKEILYFISKASVDLSFNERLIEKTSTVDLIINQYSYSVGSGASNIPSSFADIREVRFSDGGSEMGTLDKVGIEKMPETQRGSGIPSAWCIYGTNDNRVLLINTLPNMSYNVDAVSTNWRLTLYYWQLVNTFTGASEGSFTDFDETSATFGGSFLNPVEVDNVIIAKAVCNVLPMPIKNEYEVLASNLEQRYRMTKPIYFGGQLEYHYGFDLEPEVIYISNNQ